MTVAPATDARWADVAAILGGTSCWCQYWRKAASSYGRVGRGQIETRVAKHQLALREQTAATPPPGMLAYVDSRPVGWCGFGPRARMERLVRSRTLPAVDDVAVWSIVCFLVRPGFRRRGVAAGPALPRAASGIRAFGVIAHARAEGAPALEAYPVDPGGRRIDTTFAYVGTTPVFERAGFRRVADTAARSARLPRWLMRLDLT